MLTAKLLNRLKRAVNSMMTDLEFAFWFFNILKFIASICLIEYIIIKLLKRKKEVNKEKELQEQVYLLTKQVKKAIAQSNEELMILYKHQNYMFLLNNEANRGQEPKDIAKASELEFMYFKVLTSKNALSRNFSEYSDITQQKSKF